MTLSAGTRLGPYVILAPIGAGGMGEVYRARDAKLDRDVAVKVLPSQLTASPDALARFEREAKAVAALSHPNILAIFEFAVKLSRTPSEAGKSDVAALRKIGLSDLEIVDLVLSAAIFGWANRLMNTLGEPIRQGD